MTVNTFGCMWVPHGACGCIMMHIESLCVPLGVNGSLWRSVVVYRCLWVHAVASEPLGGLWVHYGDSGCLSVAVGAVGGCEWL